MLDRLQFPTGLHLGGGEMDHLIVAVTSFARTLAYAASPNSTKRPKANCPGPSKLTPSDWRRTGAPDHRQIDSTLPSQPKASDRRAIAIDVLVGQVGEHAPALSDQFQEATTRVEVVAVLAQMILQAIDALGQQRDLNFRRTGVLRMRLKLRNNRVFVFAL